MISCQPCSAPLKLKLTLKATTHTPKETQAKPAHEKNASRNSSPRSSTSRMALPLLLRVISADAATDERDAAAAAAACGARSRSSGDGAAELLLLLLLLLMMPLPPSLPLAGWECDDRALKEEDDEKLGAGRALEFADDVDVLWKPDGEELIADLGITVTAAAEELEFGLWGTTLPAGFGVKNARCPFVGNASDDCPDFGPCVNDDDDGRCCCCWVRDDDEEDDDDEEEEEDELDDDGLTLTDAPLCSRE